MPCALGQVPWKQTHMRLACRWFTEGCSQRQPYKEVRKARLGEGEIEVPGRCDRGLADFTFSGKWDRPSGWSPPPPAKWGLIFLLPHGPATWHSAWRRGINLVLWEVLRRMPTVTIQPLFVR